MGYVSCFQKSGRWKAVSTEVAFCSPRWKDTWYSVAISHHPLHHHAERIYLYYLGYSHNSTTSNFHRPAYVSGRLSTPRPSVGQCHRGEFLFSILFTLENQRTRHISASTSLRARNLYFSKLDDGTWDAERLMCYQNVLVVIPLSRETGRHTRTGEDSITSVFAIFDNFCGCRCGVLLIGEKFNQSETFTCVRCGKMKEGMQPVGRRTLFVENVV